MSTMLVDGRGGEREVGALWKKVRFSSTKTARHWLIFSRKHICTHSQSMQNPITAYVNKTRGGKKKETWQRKLLDFLNCTKTYNNVMDPLHMALIYAPVQIYMVDFDLT